MKKFIWIDKSGRGETSNELTLDNLLTWENETNWNDEELHEWAENAKAGDKWDDRTQEIICING
jgi:hypothetical protein